MLITKVCVFVFLCFICLIIYCLHIENKEDNSKISCYKPGAKNCIRSEIGTGTLAAQNCCYDKSGKLLTRGSGAGTPVVISPEVSSALHQLVDQVPWILCKGDWTRLVSQAKADFISCS